jgi:CheY-like chemotaxis protein
MIQSNKGHTLLIEDREVWMSWATTCTPKLTAATDGDTAGQVLSAQNPDLILLDLILPDTDRFPCSMNCADTAPCSSSW